MQNHYCRLWAIVLTVAGILFLSNNQGFCSNGAGSRYERIKSLMAGLITQYPETTRPITVGDSDSGEKIYGLQIGDGQINNLVVATHHGNEYGSTAVAMYLAQSLAAAPLSGQSVFVIPVLNIDGYNNNRRGEPAQRRTWDPNRNYPGPCGTEGPFTLRSTVALAKFIEQYNIVSSATLHTFTGAVLYPWGLSTRDTKTSYDTIFVKMGRDAAVESQYKVGNSAELIYPANGTFEDYAFWRLGIWSMLFELGRTHTPTDSEIQKMAQVNVPGLRRMFALGPKQRAFDHDFKGRCQRGLGAFDRHDE